jgi:hypothetical protein
LCRLQVEVSKPEHLPERFQFSQVLIDENYESVFKKHCITIYEKYNYDLSETMRALGYGNSTQFKKKNYLGRIPA